MSSAPLRAEPITMAEAPRRDEALSLEIHDTFDGVAERWRAFEVTAVMPPYQGFRWLELWHRHVGLRSMEKLALVEGRRGDATVFLWPFGIWSIGPVRIARWLGGKFNNYNFGLWDAAELAAITGEEMRATLEDIAKRMSIDTYEFVNQPETWDGFTNPFHMLGGTPSPSNSHVLDLEPDFDALYTRRRSSRSRRTLRRKRDQMAEAGEIRLIHATDEATVLRLVEALVDQRNARAATAGIPSVFAERGALDMTRDVLLDGLTETKGPIMEAHALEVDGIIRATYVGGTHHGRYSCFLNSFRDDELTATSPGEQLLHDLIESCCKRGMTRLDLGIGEQRYKTSWCDPDPLFDIFLPVSTAGHLHARLREFRQSVKRSIKGNPVLWKAVLKARQMRSRAGL